METKAEIQRNMRHDTEAVLQVPSEISKWIKKNDINQAILNIISHKNDSPQRIGAVRTTLLNCTILQD